MYNTAQSYIIYKWHVDIIWPHIHHFQKKKNLARRSCRINYCCTSRQPMKMQLESSMWKRRFWLTWEPHAHLQWRGDLSFIVAAGLWWSPESKADQLQMMILAIQLSLVDLGRGKNCHVTIYIVPSYQHNLMYIRRMQNCNIYVYKCIASLITPIWSLKNTN